ncbi:glycoside hydrolase family 13 protein [Alkalicoccus urumqiensis]|uniref:Glucohydrolase n=1 Tax=Alkalicoccus urumqiensis TaxID=1548213 RepID=A0A2P6MJV9_ALKUR|nr:alpha-glucosidase [Alkalicoccus urumqiensis]PRO66576.1 glucohydrolase [Alkalicoccus urumqiensis]
MTSQWWKDAVVYQVYPRSFADGNGDGIGDLAGILERLDYLQNLGINVLWLSPVYASPMKDNGYDISDYRAIAAEFGSMEEMQKLIKEADKRGISILMDLVVNHTSDQHAWFQESCSSRTSAKRNWYIWEDADETGAPPNNLRSIFGGSCWEWDENTGQYYFHSFAKEQPDLNWENDEVREAVYDMIRWWLDQGIAGFRVDAITFIKKPEVHKDQPADASDGTSVVKPNQPGINAFLKEMKEKGFQSEEVMTVAEAPGVAPEELPAFAGENGFFSMLIEFDHVDLDITPSGRWFESVGWTTADFRRAITRSQQKVNEGGWSALYLENHDQPRSLSRYIPEADQGTKTAKLLATVYFFLRGTPFIYQGQEIGMQNVTYASLSDYDDLSTIDQYHAARQEGLSESEAFAVVSRRSRDNARTPMQWSAEKNGGFSEGEPWLKSNTNTAVVNVEKAEKDTDSILHYYRSLVTIRRSEAWKDWLRDGIYEEVEQVHPDVFVYRRVYKEKALTVAANFSRHPVTVELPAPLEEKVAGNETGLHAEGTLLHLTPYEAVAATGPEGGK